MSSIIAAAAALWKKQHQLQANQHELHLAVNGRMDELLKVQRELARAQGIEIGEARHEERS